MCGVLSPSNTPASDPSVVLARENLGVEHVPHPHQVGSKPAGVKPPSPCPGFNELGTKILWGDFTPTEDLFVSKFNSNTVALNCPCIGNGPELLQSPSWPRHGGAPHVPAEQSVVPDVLAAHNKAEAVKVVHCKDPEARCVEVPLSDFVWRCPSTLHLV